SSTIVFCFFLLDTEPPEIYTLSLHDALPISGQTRLVLPKTLIGLLQAFGIDASSERDVKDALGWAQEARKQTIIEPVQVVWTQRDRKSTRLNSSHVAISYAVFCLKKKNTDNT